MCIMNGMDKQDLQLSCSSCVREGGPVSPVVTSSPDTALRVRPGWASPVPRPALLERAGWELWELLGQRLGRRAQREGGCQRSCTKTGGSCPGQCPPAQQRCSARGSLGLGMSCFGPQRELLSPPRGEAGSQHSRCEKWHVSVLVSRVRGTAVSAVPPCLPTEPGSASAPQSLCWRVGWAVSSPAGVLQAARSPGLCSLGNCRDITAQPHQELLAAGRVLGHKLQARGRRTGLVRWERPLCPRVRVTVWSRGHCAL